MSTQSPLLPPYEEWMELYCRHVKLKVATQTTPSEVINIEGTGRLAHIAPLFRLWDPVSQYGAAPP